MRRAKEAAPEAVTSPAAPSNDASAAVAAEIVKQRYRVVPTGSIAPHPRNPRRGAQGLIDESVEANGFYGACLVQKSTNLILVGNHRWKSASVKGLKRVPAIFVDVDDATAMRIMLADNRTSDRAGYDNTILLVLLRERATAGDLYGTGFAGGDVDRLVVQPPESFPMFNENIQVDFRCPKCGYKWSGGKTELRGGGKNGRAAKGAG